ncbi:MAG TPA: sortase [Trebonia sp.]|nr:sortase [Trebonia sp.]
MGIAVLIVGALAAFGLSLLAASRGRPDASKSAPPTRPSTPAPRGLDHSPAVRLRIPTIGVDGALQNLTLNKDRQTMQLPKPASAGWYAQGAAPGEVGPTIIVGYIAGPKGPGVFLHLGALKVGAQVDVRRADGKDVVYRVDQIASYSAKTFPVTKVYARTDRPTLRLITCGGVLRPGQPAGNVVVYGHQLSVRA